MVVNRDWLWLLFAACCLPSVVVLVRWRLRRSPRSPIAAVLDGTMLGIAVGLSIAGAVLVVAALQARLF